MAGAERPPRPGPGTSSRIEDRSIPELISNAMSQISALLRTELRLAQGEAMGKVKQAGIGLGMLGGALVLVLASVVMLLVTIMAILAAIGAPVALAALLATLIGLGGAAGLGWLGMQRLRADALKPERTLRQLKQDRLTVKEQTR